MHSTQSGGMQPSYILVTKRWGLMHNNTLLLAYAPVTHAYLWFGGSKMAALKGAA